jgi:hypothetical protein
MCCGTPSFEFFKGEELVATLGFHHGQSMRWPGVWPADGALTSTSADYLVTWLAEHGIREPLEERARQRRMEQAARRRNDRYLALIPQEVVNNLRRAQSAEEAVRVFEKGIPDGVARAELFLKLFGCDNGSWNHYSALDAPLKGALLPSLKKQHIAGAVTKATDDQAVNGVGRWLFGERQWKSLDANTLRAILPVIGKQPLGHPRSLNRRKAMVVLAEIKTPEATQLLRSVLAGEVKVRSLREEEQEEPGGEVVFTSGDAEFEKGSDRALAGLLLAKLGDRTSLPNIQALARSAKGDDKDVLDQATGLLEKK